MTYEGVYRKGTSRERQARALRLAAEYEQKLAYARRISALANEVNTREAHWDATRAWRRVVPLAARSGADMTICRDAVQRHSELADQAKKGHL